jgi:penicillin-binding protein 2
MKRLFDISSPMDADQLRTYRHASAESWVETSAPKDIATHAAEAPLFTRSSISQKQARVGVVVLAVFFGFMVCRIAYLQLIQGQTYAKIALQNTERAIPIPASRGAIVDREGRALTMNVPKFSLAVIPYDLSRDPKERERSAEIIARIAGIPTSTLWALLSTYASYRYDSITLVDNLPHETALRLDVALSDVPGIIVLRGAKRQYVDPFAGDIPASSTVKSLSHVLGYTGALSPDELRRLREKGYIPSDTLGKSGVEYTRESFLRGTFGKRKISVDAFGREQQVLSITAPIPGNHVRLTIDAAMQQRMEMLLQNQLRRIGARRGSAIVLNPKNGEVLALVSLPAYDNNDFSGGISSVSYASYIENPDAPLFSRAIGGTFPSGSTIKPLIATAALEEGIITPETKIISSGGIQVGPWFFPDWKPGGHGPTDLDLSLAWSVNTYYYTIGGGYGDRKGLGIDTIRAYLSRFGFASTTGIDLPGEARGFLPSKEWKKERTGEQWYIGDTYNVSIGQGDILVTPLQLAYSTGLIAAQGTGYTPHVALSTVDAVSGKEYLFEKTIRDNHIFSAQSLSAVRRGMYACVSRGSCAALRDLPFASGAKTGTAQWKEGKKHFAWFTSFAPYNDPELVVTVLIEEGGEGGIVSAPVVRDFYAWWYQYMRSKKPSSPVRVDSPIDSTVIL